MKNKNMSYLTAARGERPDKIPIVIEIQMAVCTGFKKLVKKYGFEGICRNAELSAQCTVMPVHDLGVDAAIHMSDLLIPVEAMGLNVKHTMTGPLIENPVRTIAGVEKLIIPEPQEDMSTWLEALRIAKRELTGKVPLIGWAGAPLSTAAFIIEGGLPVWPTPYQKIKTMMYTNPKVLHGLLEKLTDMYMRFTSAQIDAGADVMMLFDLNAPAVMSPHDYHEFAFPYLKQLVNSLKSREVPIVFASDGTTFLSSPVAALGIDVIGLDWTIGMSDAIRRLGKKQVVQGNLEPYCLFAPEEVIEKRVKKIIEEGKAAPAHIFSLGGWVLMDTPYEKVKYLVDFVHSL